MQASGTAPAAGQTKGTTGPATVAPSAARVTVTSSTMQAGQVVSPGNLIGEVSGRPVFAVPVSVPLYRNLTVGARGADVRALQQLLIDLDYYGVTASGTFDAGTLDALRRHYDYAGYELPYITDGVRGISLREFAFLPSFGGAATRVATVGTELDEETPLVTVQISERSIAAIITVAERDAVEVGSDVGVSVDGAAPVPTTVVRIGEFSTDAETGTSGYPISVAIPEGTNVDAASTLRIVSISQGDPVPAVPVVALRQEGNSTYVLLYSAPDEGEEPPPTIASGRVDVQVLMQADGWASIEPDDELPVGKRLVVAP